MNIQEIISVDSPVLLVGPPGVGKTEIIKSCAEYTEIMLCSTMVEEDIGGLAYRVTIDNKEYDDRTIPSIFRRLWEAHHAGKTSILFLDELDKSRRSVADTLLTLVAGRKAGNSELPPTTAIVAAANPPNMSGSDGISSAMQSRFITIPFLPNVKAWSRWASSKYKSRAALSIISGVQNGVIPIFDMAGTDLDTRVTSPRTLEMLLRRVEKGVSDENLKYIAKGLLTPGAASMAVKLASGKGSDVLDRAAKALNGIVESDDSDDDDDSLISMDDIIARTS